MVLRYEETGEWFASAVRFPDRRPHAGHAVACSGVVLGFCGGHGPGVTPGYFPNPVAKAWRGDGTALDRVWESSTPPQLFLVGPEGVCPPGLFHMSHASSWVTTMTAMPPSAYYYMLV